MSVGDIHGSVLRGQNTLHKMALIELGECPWPVGPVMLSTHPMRPLAKISIFLREFLAIGFEKKMRFFLELSSKQTFTSFLFLIFH